MTGTRRSAKIGILGASGYTGAELVRLLARHPHAAILTLTADRRAGESLEAVFPHLGGLTLPALSRIEDVDWSSLDLVFCALPHATTQSVVRSLPDSLKIVDLSADFRLADVETYAAWYGQAHLAPDLQATAVYGLTEFARTEVAPARLVANPGCYPTAAQLALVPLVEERAIDVDDIIIDAKSGVSGAGRSAKEANLFTEVTEGIHAYGVGAHRHAPEIEQGLSRAAGGHVVRVNFTPHLMPMSRGILETIYVKLTDGLEADDLREILERRYDGERFVRMLAPGKVPATRYVRGSNHCHLNVFADRVPGRAIVIAVLDNLVKGAAGQAVQNMNLMLGFDEEAGLHQEALFP